MSGTANIPESVVAIGPIFGGPFASLKIPIPFAIDIDPDSESLLVVPFPGALETAICGAEDILGNMLRSVLGENCDAIVNYGVP